jgi:lauroyl/myristoyl acyltransferase
VAVENLKNAFPEKDTRWIIRVARDSNRNLFISLFELFILPKFTIDELKKNITFRNPGVFEEVYRRKRGLIIMSAHFGKLGIIRDEYACTFEFSGIHHRKTAAKLLHGYIPE